MMKKEAYIIDYMNFKLVNRLKVKKQLCQK